MPLGKVIACFPIHYRPAAAGAFPLPIKATESPPSPCSLEAD